jgi:hypothetical protein
VGLGVLLAAVAAAPAQAIEQPEGAIKNVELLANLPEAKDATAINFLEYGHGHGRGGDVMLVTGRFGLKTYDLSNPAAPALLDEFTAEELRLPGDPPVSATSTFWQNEDMDVDTRRKLAIISRDPRAYLGSTSREPGDPDPNGATNIAGAYIIDVQDPRNLKLLSFTQLPTGHTSTCINGCDFLWTGGPASTTRQRDALGWALGRPLIVTDIRNPREPVAYPQRPVDLFRADGVTAYSHDVQVDADGIAWVSGNGGTRGYRTSGWAYDPVQGKKRLASPLDPIPYAGGGFPDETVGPTAGGFMHNAWRPVGHDAPRGDKRYRKGELLLATEEDFGPGPDACKDRGQFTIASLEGSYNGESWRSTPAQPFRLKRVGNWNPFEKEGTRSDLSFCSAHYFDVDGPLVTYAWYGQGTRFLDISDPANPVQIAYYRPDNTNVWASYYHEGYIYTADQGRGVDVLRFTRRHREEVAAPPTSAAQTAYLKTLSRKYVPDSSTGLICLLPRI